MTLQAGRGQVASPRQAPAAVSAPPTAQESAAPVPAGNGGTLLSWPSTPWQPHQAPGARGPCLVTQQHRLWQSPCLLRVGLRSVCRWRVVSTHCDDDAHLSGKETGPSSRGVGRPGVWTPKDVCSCVNPVLYWFPTPRGGRPRRCLLCPLGAPSQSSGSGRVRGSARGRSPFMPLLWSPLLNEQGEVVFPEPFPPPPSPCLPAGGAGKG